MSSDCLHSTTFESPHPPDPLRLPGRLRWFCGVVAAGRMGFVAFALGGLAFCGALLAGWTLRLALSEGGQTGISAILLVLSWAGWLVLAALLLKRKPERKDGILLSKKLHPGLAALSQAGLEVSAIKLGLSDTRWTALLTEAGRMKLEMEQTEPLIQHHEAELERRFAAALGLLWWADETMLSAAMRERQRLLPSWVGVYEAMAEALPQFRETLTGVFTLQTLAARAQEASDSGCCMAVLHHLVPRLLNQARQIRAALDGAFYPETEKGTVMPLAEFLFADPIPDSPHAWLQGTEDLGLQDRVFKLASDAAQFMSPFADRYLLVYHHAYGWLAETAERAELCFVDSPRRSDAAAAIKPPVRHRAAGRA